MLYPNDSFEALSALESQRLGNYGNNDDNEDATKICPECGQSNPEHFIIYDGECCGCSSCMDIIALEDYVI